ncbi:hypothetical protein GGS24DRAFT_456571 [Hypoxylon argillaceum]|nr:hypothetical protein GGS24DRAFT_456571 [Hypoxylon argillaceum]
MTPRSMFCLRRAATHTQPHHNLELHLRRYVSQQNPSPQTLLPTFRTRAGSPPPRLGSDGSLRQQTAYRHHPLRRFTTTAATRMASDEDYMAFLDKVNRDPNEGYAKPQSSSGKDTLKATDDGASIPAAIQEATKDAFYVSDADEPFVPVCLAWDEAGKGLPDEEEFATLIHHPDPSQADISIQDPADWDTQGQYQAILEAVRQAGKGNDVRVYRVAKGGVKAEYWVVTTDGKGKGARLVGAKALAVES